MSSSPIAQQGGSIASKNTDGLRVALIHDWLTGMRGGEKVLEALSSLFPDATIYCLFHLKGSVSEQLESHAIRTTYLRWLPSLRKHYRYYLPLFPRAIESLDLSSYDLVISSSHCVAKGVRTPAGTPHVCYCHTPVRYAWDQEDAYFPNSTGPIATLRSRLLANLRRWDRSTARRVDTFVANSRFVAERIGKYYGRPAKVVAPPVDLDFFTPAAAPSQEAPYALSVAALAPYKRHDVAIEACSQLGLDLRIVGDGPDAARLRSTAKDLQGNNMTQFLGRVGPEELRELYRNAAVFVQPGIEDFGIAAVESLACGTPVAALGVGGIRDIVVDGAHGAFSIDEASAPDLASAIERTLSLDLKTAHLRQRAEEFAAERFATAMEQILETAITRRI